MTTNHRMIEEGNRLLTITRALVKVPVPVIYGKYELLTTEELDDITNDLIAETRRRRDAAA